MKICIVTTTIESYENNRLLNAGKELGHDIKIVGLDDVVIEIDSTNTGAYVNGENLKDYDIVTITIQKKRALILSNLLQQLGVKIFDNNLTLNKFQLDKISDAVTFYKNGLSFPKTVNVADEEDFRDTCNEIGFPIVVKHSVSSTGKDVFKLNDLSEVDEFLEKLEEEHRNTSSYILQQNIPFSQSLRIMVINGKIAGAAKKEMESKKNSAIPVEILTGVELSSSTQKLALDAVKSINMHIASVDILIGEDGKEYLLDVNRTPGFEKLEKVGSADYAKLILETAIEKAV